MIKNNPNGNVQFVIAQLGPILQRISDQLYNQNTKSEKRIKKDYLLTSRSESLEIKSSVDMISTDKKKSNRSGNRHSNNYSKFCLSLIK